MAKYYFYDNTKEMGYHGYKSEAGVIKAAAQFLKEHPDRHIGIYEEQEYGGSLLGHVSIGKTKGRKVIKYTSEYGTFPLNADGSFKDCTRYIATYYSQHGRFTDLNTARKEGAELSKKNGYDSVVICKNYAGSPHGLVWKEGNNWIYETRLSGKSTYFDPKTGKAVKGR